MIANFKVLILQLMPTFLRSGILKAWLHRIATTLQRRCNTMYDYCNNQREVVRWTSERKAMRERLNILFLNKHYSDNESPDPLQNEYIEVQDYVDVKHLIMYDDNDWDTDEEILENDVILKATEEGEEATIIWNIEDRSLGCDLRVIIPTLAHGDGTFSSLVSEIYKLKNETNRLIFAGLLCKFYEARIIDNNIIYKEI